MASKKKLFFTPIGSVEPFAYLTKPDYGNPERGFGNPRGVYKASLTFQKSDPKVQDLMDQIVKLHEQSYNERLEAHNENPPPVVRGKKPLEPYEGDMPFMDNGDGTVTFKFSAYATYQDSKTKETKTINVAVVDSRGKRIEELPAFIGAGSQCKFRFSMFAYGWSNVAGASVKLQLDSVMLVELASFGGGDEGWGEEAEAGGYVGNSRGSDGGWDEAQSRHESQQAEQAADDDDF